eukprot:PhM_4_TR15221/c0_g1_i1/m.95997
MTVVVELHLNATLDAPERHTHDASATDIDDTNFGAFSEFVYADGNAHTHLVGHGDGGVRVAGVEWEPEALRPRTFVIAQVLPVAVRDRHHLDEVVDGSTSFLFGDEFELEVGLPNGSRAHDQQKGREVSPIFVRGLLLDFEVCNDKLCNPINTCDTLPRGQGQATQNTVLVQYIHVGHPSLVRPSSGSVPRHRFCSLQTHHSLSFAAARKRGWVDVQGCRLKRRHVHQRKRSVDVGQNDGSTEEQGGPRCDVLTHNVLQMGCLILGRHPLRGAEAVVGVQREDDVCIGVQQATLGERGFATAKVRPSRFG